MQHFSWLGSTPTSTVLLLKEYYQKMVYYLREQSQTAKKLKLGGISVSALCVSLMPLNNIKDVFIGCD